MAKNEVYRITADNMLDAEGRPILGFSRFTHSDDWAGEGEFTLIQKRVDGRWVNMKLVPDD